MKCCIDLLMPSSIIAFTVKGIWYLKSSDKKWFCLITRHTLIFFVCKIKTKNMHVCIYRTSSVVYRYFTSIGEIHILKHCGSRYACIPSPNIIPFNNGACIPNIAHRHLFDCWYTYFFLAKKHIELVKANLVQLKNSKSDA